MNIEVTTKRLNPLVFLAIVFSTGCAASNGSECVTVNNIDVAREIMDAQLPQEYLDGQIEIVILRDDRAQDEQQTSVQIILLSRIWGNQRETKRVIVLDACANYLGNYGVNDFPVEFSGGVLLFPYERDMGNKLVINGAALSEMVRLDGEMIYLEMPRSR